jgi:hypothetical protein
VSCLRFKPGTSETEVTNVTSGANFLNATIIIKYEPRGGRQWKVSVLQEESAFPSTMKLADGLYLMD